MSTSSASSRLFWCAVVALAAGYALYQVYDCGSRFLAEPVSGQRDTVYDPHLPPPALTLCNHILDGMTLMYTIKGVTPDAAGLAGLHWQELGNDTIPVLLRQTAVGTEKALSSCQLSNQPCAAVGSWSRRLHSSAGDCFTFTPNGSDPLQVGSGYNVTFLLPRSVYINLDHTMYVLLNSRFQEFKSNEGSMMLSVYVHDADEPFTTLPWIQPLESLEVGLGAQAEVRVAMEVIDRVSQRHLPCESNSGYSRVRCALACHAAAAAATTGLDCRVTDMPTNAPLCGNFANYSAVQRAFTTAEGARPAMERCHRRCPRPCHQRLFHAHQQKSYGRDDMQSRKFMLRVYYAGQETERYSEQWAYGVSALIGEAGGVIGLMLGLSVLSVFEMAQEMIDTLFGRLAAACSTA